MAIQNNSSKLVVYPVLSMLRHTKLLMFYFMEINNYKSVK